MDNALASSRGHDVIGFWDISTAHPERVAIVDAEGGDVSYGKLRVWSGELAAGMLDLGLRPGGIVAVVLGSEPAYVATQLATSQLGLYFMAVNRHLTASEIAYVLADSGAQILVSSTASDAAREAAELAGIGERYRFSTTPADGMRDLAELARADARPDPSRRQAGETMFYTSGTTGQPKGVRRPLPGIPPEESAARLLSAAYRRYGWPPGDHAHLVLAPLYHSAPNRWAMTSLHSGGKIVLTGKWDPERTLSLIERYQITSTQMVPTMFHRLLALPASIRARYDLSSLRYVLHSAAPCPVHEKRAMLKWWGPVLYEYYSSTEGGGTSVGPDDWLQHPGTVGRAWDGAEIAILDEAGSRLGAGEVGVVYLRNGERFEYHNDPEKTARAWRGDFFTVGDLGYLDEDGWLYLASRRSDLIISGGVNIYPAEVESVLLCHPAVADACVVGLPDDDWGSRVHAVVEPVPGAVPGPDLAAEILEFAAEQMARFKRPRTLDFRAVPRTDTGKLNRNLMREELLGGELLAYLPDGGSVSR